MMHQRSLLCDRWLRLSNYRGSLTTTVRQIFETAILNGESPHSTRSPRLQWPLPGRLQRLQPNSSSKIGSSGLGDGKERATHETYNQLAQKSRIDERREAIARRRLFLEKSLSSPALLSTAVESDPPQKDSEISSIEISTEPTPQTATSTTASANPSKITRSAVHSLNNGRQLSAADMHRLQRTTQRTEQQTAKIQPIQQLNNKEHRLLRNVRTHRSGGSLVASQSATSRYRAQRQVKDDVESNLKMNPSVLSIPLSESYTAQVVPDDFEERLKRLKQQRDKKSEDGEKENWSLLGWFWGKK